MVRPFLRIFNHHFESCGKPPQVKSEPDLYIGYFENLFGEQWVFTYNRETGKAELRGGDVGWEKVYEVVDGEVEVMLLSREEAMWLRVCWLNAAHKNRSRENRKKIGAGHGA